MTPRSKKLADTVTMLRGVGLVPATKSIEMVIKRLHLALPLLQMYECLYEVGECNLKFRTPLGKILCAYMGATAVVAHVAEDETGEKQLHRKIDKHININMDLFLGWCQGEPWHEELRQACAQTNRYLDYVCDRATWAVKYKAVEKSRQDVVGHSPPQVVVDNVEAGESGHG